LGWSRDSARKLAERKIEKQKADQLLQLLSAGLGVFLWLAWYYVWPVAGQILPLIGDPIVRAIVPLLPANVQPLFNNSLMAAALAALVIACAVWAPSIWLVHEPLGPLTKIPK
jgi:hypothetical protein